jgi:hypothetical protein
MSLKSFHLIFISAAIVLSFGFGAWWIRIYCSPTGGAWDLVFGLASVGAGVALIFYERYFLRKTKNVSYL